MKDDVYWMRKAMTLARHAAACDEVPVGAIIIHEDKIIGEGWNQPISANDPTAHAEIIALRDAGNRIGNYRLPDTTMYVTLEPCAMCAGAIVHARLTKLVYAVADQKTGACGSVFQLLQTEALNHQVETGQGILEEECRTMLQDFFKAKRLKQ